MIQPATITRNDTEGITYFVGEIQEDKFYGLFVLYDTEAAQDISASLEYVGSSVPEVLSVMKEMFRPKKSNSAAETKDGASEPPAKRKRIAVQ